jgi:sialic acid synthase SpsE
MRDAEAKNKQEFQRVIVASQDVQIGEVFSESNIAMGRVAGGKGLVPKMINLVIGKTANSNYRRGDAIEL